MTLLVTSATGANGAGYGKILAFADDGKPIGVFGDDSRIADPPRRLDTLGEYVLPPNFVPFPRGFAFGHDGTLFLASGIGPGGEGDNTILALDSDRRMLPSWKVRDPELSPLDLTIAPSGNIVVSSEHPFGAANAVTTIREYDHADGRLARVLVPKYGVRFHKPRGLRFGPHARLYCVAQDEVVAFDFETGDCLGPVVTLPGLNGQALIFFP